MSQFWMLASDGAYRKAWRKESCVFRKVSTTDGIVTFLFGPANGLPVFCNMPLNASCCSSFLAHPLSKTSTFRIEKWLCWTSCKKARIKTEMGIQSLYTFCLSSSPFCVYSPSICFNFGRLFYIFSFWKVCKRVGPFVFLPFLKFRCVWTV